MARKNETALTAENLDTIKLEGAEMDVLEELKARIQEEIDDQLMRKRTAIRQRAIEMAAAEGIDITEIFPVAAPRGRRATGPKSPPQYRNPADLSQTWTGMGRKPNWLVEAMEQGHDIEEFRIITAKDEDDADEDETEFMEAETETGQQPNA